MKKIYLLICILAVSLISCDDVDVSADNNFTKVTFKVTSNDENHQAKIRTVFAESGFFKIDKTNTAKKLPYEKSYSASINFSASAALIYEDKSEGTFKNYIINVEILRDNVLYQEKAFTIDYLGKKVDFDVMVNN
ncbi:hypothetical protein [Tenacibaculum insulae]|uniref:hypothetical protein n=1 Tax=Tenacibaculum insulae TaxID=2029677 RepID=UPI003AB6898F